LQEDADKDSKWSCVRDREFWIIGMNSNSSSLTLIFNTHKSYGSWTYLSQQLLEWSHLNLGMVKSLTGERKKFFHILGSLSDVNFWLE